jgi:release factor glutamine methyltransferase
VTDVLATLRDAAARLAGASATPRLDAELLMAHALGVSREALLLDPICPVPASFEALLARRAASEPVAYIIGHKPFWTIDLAVTPAVLIPRPDSETLIEAAIDHFAGAAPRTVLDLGTGSGALLLAALDQWPGARGIGVDRSAAAIAVAQGNARRLGLADRALFVMGDWAGAIDARFDLVLCNPPYVESGAALPADVALHEPAGALFAGPDGMDDYRRLLPALPALIADGGVAAIEIGAEQGAAVAALAQAAGLVASVRRDLAGLDRCIVARPAPPTDLG